VYLIVGKLKYLNNSFYSWKLLLILLLKKNINVFSKLETNLLKLISWIDWKPFLIIFEFIYFNKTIFLGRHKVKVIIISKMLILQQLYSLSDFELEKQRIDRTSFQELSWFFLSTYQTVPQSVHSEKKNYW